MHFLSSLIPISFIFTGAFADDNSKDPLYDGFPPEGISPLALGLYATPETKEPVELEIIGTIPKWIKGSLYRGAQAGWDVGNYTSEHWFDGFSRNHRWEVEDGKVTYRSRNGSDELQDFIRETGLYPGGSFAGDPCKAVFGAFETSYRDQNNPIGDIANGDVNVGFIKNFPGLARNTTNFGPFVTLVRTTDGTPLQQIDPVTLEPLELFTHGVNDLEIGGSRSSAHPAIGDNGEVYNYLLDLDSDDAPVYQVFGVDAHGDGRILANITDAPGAYIHATFSTENYIILIVWQCDFVKPMAETGNMLDAVGDWNPDREALFYVVPKNEGGVIAKYTAPAFFAFHEVNSFETGDDIIIDIPWNKDDTWLKGLRLKNMRDNLGNTDTPADFDIQSEFVRFRLPAISKGKSEDGELNTRQVSEDFHMDFKTGNIELPRINEAYTHKPYRYAYGVHIEKPGYFVDSVIKIDTVTQTSKIWYPNINHFPSEPIFVARPGAEDEDDGVLMFVALNERTKLSALVVLDARTMREVGRARLPVVVGYGFHGIWGEGNGQEQGEYRKYLA